MTASSQLGVVSDPSYRKNDPLFSGKKSAGVNGDLIRLSLPDSSLIASALSRMFFNTLLWTSEICGVFFWLISIVDIRLQIVTLTWNNTPSTATPFFTCTASAKVLKRCSCETMCNSRPYLQKEGIWVQVQLLWLHFFFGGQSIFFILKTQMYENAKGCGYAVYGTSSNIKSANYKSSKVRSSNTKTPKVKTPKLQRWTKLKEQK